MADRPNDALQTYKVSDQKSPRGRVGEQKKYKSQKNRKATVIARKSVPSEATGAQGHKKPIKALTKS